MSEPIEYHSVKYVYFLFTVPSASPIDLTVVSISAFSVSLEWGHVPCLHRNGQITGYVLQYLGNGRNETLSIESTQNRNATIANLTTLTNYSIKIAAITSARVGVYSDSLTTETGGIIIVIAMSDNPSHHNRRIVYRVKCVGSK